MRKYLDQVGLWLCLWWLWLRGCLLCLSLYNVCAYACVCVCVCVSVPVFVAVPVPVAVAVAVPVAMAEEGYFDHWLRWEDPLWYQHHIRAHTVHCLRAYKASWQQEVSQHAGVCLFSLYSWPRMCDVFSSCLYFPTTMGTGTWKLQ